MVIVLKDYVYARKVGKVLTVPKWIKMLCSAFQIAQVMVPLISNFKHALVNQDGLVKIVQRVYFCNLYLVTWHLFPFILELCDLDCGRHGHCVSDVCQCDTGWSGEYCNLKQCDPRCNEHGQCKNGTCLCVTGWNGKHCTLEGCPNSCTSHGQCRFNPENMWECRCDSGWNGPDCSISLEQNCNDGRDNDKGWYIFIKQYLFIYYSSNFRRPSWLWRSRMLFTGRLS